LDGSESTRSTRTKHVYAEGMTYLVAMYVSWEGVKIAKRKACNSAKTKKKGEKQYIRAEED
jgi:hypothetical protein